MISLIKECTSTCEAMKSIDLSVEKRREVGIMGTGMNTDIDAEKKRRASDVLSHERTPFSFVLSHLTVHLCDSLKSIRNSQCCVELIMVKALIVISNS